MPILIQSQYSLRRFDRCGMVLFQRVCELDLEGIVAKQKFEPYVQSESKALGLKSEIPNIHNGQDAKNCSNVNGTESQ
jgi:hypothetical protein